MGAVTPHSPFRWVFQKNVSMALFLLCEIPPQIFSNLSPRLWYHVETKRRIVGGNDLYFPLSHHTYIYKKVRLYIR